jgi:hypothetical protein
MKITTTIRQALLVLAFPATCLLAVTAAPEHVSAPHRSPAPVKHTPFAAAPKNVAVGRSHRQPPKPLHLTVEKAHKVWHHDGWIRTGGIERHHYWLVSATDIGWHHHLVYWHRERYFWWHHPRIDYLVWLGQGWEYRDFHSATTRKSTSNVVVINTTPSSDVALRVEALSVMDGLQLTSDQFDAVQNVIGGMTDAGEVIDAGAIDDMLAEHPAFRETMDQLYKDYILSDDDQVLGDRSRLLQLQDKYRCSVVPTIGVTDEARAQASQIYALLTPGQIASYLAVRGQSVPDPTAILMSGLEESRHLSDSAFSAYRDNLSARMAILTLGMQSADQDSVIGEVDDLLERARPLSDADFAVQRLDFLQSAQRLAARCAPIDLLRHAIKWDLATFLSNPQAKAMASIRARQVETPATPNL